MKNEKAVEKVEGPCIILAGAGTGKTYTIVEKIKHLIENKIYAPEKIVCITFSNEAANNLSSRVNKLIGGDLANKASPVIRTFHGFSADLLRKYANNIGIKKEFKILDPDQAKIILHKSLRVNPINCHRYISTIGTAKDLGIKLEDFQNFLNNELKKYENIDLQKKLEDLNFELQTLHLRKNSTNKKSLIEDIKRIKKVIDIRRFTNAWSAYEKLKKKGDYLDYSDLNTYALDLLKKNPEISNEFSYVIVDEFQDTNKLQLDFLVMLAAHRNITIVGDLNQSIYRFRGAYRKNIVNFKEAFSVSDADIFNLNKSYRSPNKVLKAAYKLITNNYINKEESFLVENINGIDGDNLIVFETKDAKEEARKVVEIIKEEEKIGTPLEEICVMFRAHQHGRIIKKVLDESGIQYHSVSKESLLKQKSVKTVIDYLTILSKLKKNEKGAEQAWWDIVYQLDFQQSDMIKIGKAIKSVSRSNSKEEKENQKENISEYLLNNLERFDLSNNGKMSAKILIEKIKLMLSFIDKPLSELIQEVYRISGLTSDQKTIEERQVMLNLSRFYEIAKIHEELYDSDLSNFIYYLDIIKDLEIEIEAPRLEEKGVRLMTSHATKGLEFKTIIITNFAQGRFPVERYSSNNLIPTEVLPEVKEEITNLNEEERESFIASYEKHHQLQEERRLAYVSFTRAKEKLFLTFAQEYSEKKVFPSQFLDEISFKSNPDILFKQDLELKYNEIEPQIKAAINFSSSSTDKNFSGLLEEVTNEKTKEPKEHKRLSPSALLLFSDCQKEFEYRYMYNMPERKTFSWEAMRLGSFVHLVLEKGVKSKFKSLQDFLQLAKEISLDEEWASVDPNESETLIKVFFERHKNKFDEKSMTEQYLPLQLADADFIGFADRIDFIDGGIQIVDYKTGKSSISPRDRNWQLGFYALAAEKIGKVKKVILDMLKQDRPIEFEIDDNGNALCTSSKFIPGFNIYEVQKELIETANQIQNAYEEGFKPCPVEKNCDFCNEYVYGL